MATFTCLSEQRGKVVSREAILNGWPADCGRSGDALTHAIHELREAFEDDPRRPRYIRTVRARGYQLINAAVQQGVEAPVRKRGVLRYLSFGSFFAGYWSVAVGVSSWIVQFIFPPLDLAPAAVLCLTLTLAAISLVGWVALTIVLWKLLPDFHVPALFETALMHIERHRAAWIVLALTVVLTPLVPAALSITTDQRCHRCIAVLPFSYESADSSYSYLARGLPDELIAVLARVTPIQVLSSTVTFDPKLADLDLKTIAQRLRVAYLVQGRISVENGEVRIRATLVDATTGKPVWSSEKYQQHLASVFDLYDKVATHLSEELQVALNPDSDSTLKRMQSPSEDAYALYLHGRDMLRRPAEGDVLQEAGKYFQRAIDEDPHFARAFAGLCETSVAQYRASRDNAFIEKANNACGTALALDASAQEVQLALGRLHTETGNYAAAELALEAALRLNRKYYEAHVRLGDLRSRQQRYHDAQSEYETAIALQPGNWIAYSAEGLLLCQRTHEFAQGTEKLKRVIELQPESAKAFNNLGACHMFEGRLEDALTVFTSSNQLAPNPSTLANIGVIDLYLGKVDDAISAMEQVVAIDQTDHRVRGNLAMAQSYSDMHRDQAPETYRTAIELANERLATDPSDADALADIATYFAALGQRTEALTSLDKALAQSPDDAVLLYLAACTYALLDMHAEAARAACASIDHGQPRRIVESDPRLSTLRQSEEYRACRRQ